MSRSTTSKKNVNVGVNNTINQNTYIFDFPNTAEVKDYVESIVYKGEVDYRWHLEVGWDYLCKGKFDSAKSEFNSAFTHCDPKGHEAYFGYALADSRIQLLDLGGKTDDKKNDDTFNKIPVYCEIDGLLGGSFESNSYYKKALEFAAGTSARKKYQNCAKQISKIIEEFNRYSSQSKKYDCFICSKVTELDKSGNPIEGTKTKDCNWAVKLHKKLKEEGLNPFFSECDITGQADAVSERYESLILHALIHAKCMIVVCSDNKYYSKSIFMQNEYRRFVSFLRGRGLTLNNIILVSDNYFVTLPYAEGGQSYIKTGNDADDLQKVYEAVFLKVNGNSVAGNLKKYCDHCEKWYAANFNYCPVCANELVTLKEYQETEQRKVDEYKAQKQREIEAAEREAQKKICAANAKQYLQITPIPLRQIVVRTEKEHSKKLEKLTAAAKNGSARAQYKLGQLCLHGKKKGIEYDYDTAISLLYYAAESGYTAAQFELGKLLHNGCVDYEYSEEAFRFFRLAAEKGHVEAQAYLGIYYAAGVTVKKDIAQAVKWWRKAAYRDSELAREMLSIYREYTDYINEKDYRDFGRFDLINFIISSCFFILLIVFLFLYSSLFNFRVLFPSASGYMWLSLFCINIISILYSVCCGIYGATIRRSLKISFLNFFFCAICIVYVFLMITPFYKNTPDYMRIQKFDTAQNGICYNLETDGTAVLGAAETYLKEIVIPEKVGNNTVTVIGEHAFVNCDKLKSIVIPENIKIIGDSAFAGCDSLKTVYWNAVSAERQENSQYTIWGKNNNIENVIIGDNVESIPYGAFGGCDKLKSIVIPENIRIIGDSAFAECDSLKTVYWNAVSAERQENLQYTIWGENNVEKVIFGDKVESIPYSTFHRCEQLTEVYISDSVKSIDQYAFNDCKKLTAIYIPAGVSYVGYGTFDGCENLTVYCEAESAPKSWGSGWDYNGDEKIKVVWNVSREEFENIRNANNEI